MRHYGHAEHVDGVKEYGAGITTRPVCENRCQGCDQWNNQKPDQVSRIPCFLFLSFKYIQFCRIKCMQTFISLDREQNQDNDCKHGIGGNPNSISSGAR